MKDDPSNLSMLELFRAEAENQTALLTNGLIQIEASPAEASAPQLESLMRAAHSLKGAARIVNLPSTVRVAHAMEDCFVAAQQGKLQLRQPHIDVLLRGVDLLAGLSRNNEKNLAAWEQERATQIEDFISALARSVVPSAKCQVSGEPDTSHLTPRTSEGEPDTSHLTPRTSERVLRLTAENLNRLLGLAGESLVESRWLRPFSESMQRLKRMQSDLERTLDGLRQSLDGENLSEGSRARVNELFRQAAETRQFLGDRLQELDLFDRRSLHLSNRLYLEVLRTRMRPFGDGTRRFPRMVRDLARSLGKQARLEITGENTQVDRDILDRLETPLAHLLRNAVDHGCETPEERERCGKPPEATIQLEARHSAGMLMVVVSDDGAGLDSELLRRVIVEKQLTTPALARRMNEAELLQFLFLPGFTLRDTVTELSGRGVGLDIVQNMVRSVRGSVRVRLGKNAETLKTEKLKPDFSVSAFQRFSFSVELQLPLTLSVLRALLVEVGGEPYAFPLAQIAQTLNLPRENIETLEGRQYFTVRGAGGQVSGGPDTSHLTPDTSACVGLLAAHQVFGVENTEMLKTEKLKPDFSISAFQPFSFSADLPIVVLGDRNTRYGLLVDRFLGERELVVQPLDPRLGKVKDISAAALMEDGSPVLIVDVDDMMRSIEKLITSGTLANLPQPSTLNPQPSRKRILAVDDSLTVRELERKLLTRHGYLADVAVDGMDGWNMLMQGKAEMLKTETLKPISGFPDFSVSAFRYQLVITDVDMPRMDGIELTTLIKRDPHLKSLPVMIVSYKDREENRLRGLEAGADYYLTKGSFQDETLLQAVQDLIGSPCEIVGAEGAVEA